MAAVQASYFSQRPHRRLTAATKGITPATATATTTTTTTASCSRRDTVENLRSSGSSALRALCVE